jgi:hypothetical protein
MPAGRAIRAGQRAGAEALYSCLIDAGLPATIGPADGDQDGMADIGRLRVLWDTGQIGLLLSRDDRGTVSIHDGANLQGMDLAIQADIQRFMRVDPFTFKLQIDGVDHSAAYADCVVSSGYEVPTTPVDPAELMAPM